MTWGHYSGDNSLAVTGELYLKIMDRYHEFRKIQAVCSALCIVNEKVHALSHLHFLSQQF